ncbi:hypothetical protein [Halospeciosus flavus]|uniref:hypothetical protein n=1 Tax=Halospeciosus flavus TaxID=3032283 RepID=UPI003620F0AC
MTDAGEDDDGSEQPPVNSEFDRQPQRPDGGWESTQEDVEKRHRILRSLREQLEHHPAIISAWGARTGSMPNLSRTSTQHSSGTMVNRRHYG